MHSDEIHCAICRLLFRADVISRYGVVIVKTQMRCYDQAMEAKANAAAAAINKAVNEG